MQFNRLTLKNWKCYETESVEFSDGITVISGENGAGKSTLLEAAFFALYGTDALPADETREDVITKDKEECKVDLWFSHNDTEYHIHRRVSNPESSDNVYSDVELETPTDTYTTVTRVAEEIRDILRMDADAFLNCSYVRQGDITRLIHADPDDRQDIIDELLQLGQLETYKNRMANVLRGARRLKRELETDLERIQDRIDELESQDLSEQLDSVTNRLDEISNNLEQIEADLEAARDDRDTAQDALDDIQATKDELEDLRSELQDAEDALSDAESTVEARASDLEDAENTVALYRQELTDALTTLSDDVDHDIDPEDPPADPDDTALHTALEAHEHRQEDLESELDALREEIRDKERTVQDHKQTSERLREEATDADDAADDAASDLEDLQADLEAVESDLEAKRTEREHRKDRFSDDDIPDDVAFGDADNYTAELEAQLGDIREEKSDVQAELRSLTDDIDYTGYVLLSLSGGWVAVRLGAWSFVGGGGVGGWDEAEFTEAVFLVGADAGDAVSCGFDGAVAVVGDVLAVVDDVEFVDVAVADEFLGAVAE